jgi:hypothetical protein
MKAMSEALPLGTICVVMGFCECGNEPPGCVKDRKFVE